MILSPDTFPKGTVKLEYSIWKGFPEFNSLMMDKTFKFIVFLIIFLYCFGVVLYILLFKEVILLNILSFIGFFISSILFISVNKALANDKNMRIAVAVSIGILFLLLFKNIIARLKSYAPKYRPAGLVMILLNIFIVFTILNHCKNDVSFCQDSGLLSFHKEEKIFIPMPIKNGEYYILMNYYDVNGKIIDWMIRKIELNTDIALISPFISSPYLGVNDSAEIPFDIYNLKDKRLLLDCKVKANDLELFPQKVKLELDSRSYKKVFFDLIPDNTGRTFFKIDLLKKSIKWPVFIDKTYNTSYFHDEDDNISGNIIFETQKNGADLTLKLKNKTNSNISFSILMPKLPSLRYLSDQTKIEFFQRNYVFSGLTLPSNKDINIEMSFGKLFNGEFSRRELVIFYFMKDSKKYNSLRITIPDYRLGEELFLIR